MSRSRRLENRRSTVKSARTPCNHGNGGEKRKKPIFADTAGAIVPPSLRLGPLIREERSFSATALPHKGGGGGKKKEANSCAARLAVAEWSGSVVVGAKQGGSCQINPSRWHHVPLRGGRGGIRGEQGGKGRGGEE